MTGGAGFVGSHVSAYYADKRDEVVVLDNLSRGKTLGVKLGDVVIYNWKFLKKSYPAIKLVKGDIRDFASLKKACKDIEVIVHTAAQVAVTSSVRAPRTDFEINALGTFNVLEAARLNDAAVVYCSTNKVYGENVNGIPVREGVKRYSFADERYKEGIPENFPIDLHGHSPYGCSKLAGDLYVQDYAHTYGLKTGVFRMSCIYGERQFGVEDQGWVSWFMIANLKGKPVTIYGDGKQVRDVLYVGDLVKAYDAFLKSNLKHGVFNIGGGADNTLSLLELLEMLTELTGRENVVRFDDWRPADQKVYISDITKAGARLGWKPEVGPWEGVKRIIRWFTQDYKSTAGSRTKR